jgi:polyferredoxin
VDVCPTGIDIRNGTQLECINCTACIDACDSIMVKIDKPKGLIRYASETSIAEKRPHKYTTRAKAYTVVLGILLVLMGFLLRSRPTVDATILRASGMTYIEQGSDIANLYNFKVLNKSAEKQQVEFRMISPENVRLEFAGSPNLLLEVGHMAQGAFMVIIPPDQLKSSKTDVVIGIYANGQLAEKVTTNFNGPRK